MAQYTFTKNFQGYVGGDFPTYLKKVGDVVTGEPAPPNVGGGLNIIVPITAKDNANSNQKNIFIPIEYFQKQYTFTKDFSTSIKGQKKDFFKGNTVTGDEISVNGKKVLRLTMLPQFGNLDIPMEYFGESLEDDKNKKSNKILIYAAVAVGSILLYKYILKK